MIEESLDNFLDQFKTFIDKNRQDFFGTPARQLIYSTAVSFFIFGQRSLKDRAKVGQDTESILKSMFYDYFPIMDNIDKVKQIVS